MLSSSFHRKIISGEAGVWASPLRLGLRAVAIAYSLGVEARNKKFDRGRGVIEVAASVISVGNITVGGTGKTPMVIDLVHRLQRLDKTPAIVARGYKASTGSAGDEELLIRRRVPRVHYIANPNRAEGAADAIRAGADVIVLDDGFQHRALARDLDIVLIDATCPFGFDHVLPRGLLREPIHRLRRADLLIVTRADGVTEEVIIDIRARLAELAIGCPMLTCTHKPVSITRVDGTDRSSDPRDFLTGKTVLAFSGLANPEAFEQTVSSLGARVVASKRWPDHHPYSVSEVRSMLEDADNRKIELCVTSEKDAVKLASLTGIDPDRIAVVQIAIDFGDEDATILDELLDRAVRQSKHQ